MELFVLYQTDIYKSTASRVCFGVFDTHNKAVDAAKENDLYSHNSEIVIEPTILNQFREL